MDFLSVILIANVFCVFFSIMFYIFCVSAMYKYMKHGTNRKSGIVYYIIAVACSILPVILLSGNYFFKFVLLVFDGAVLYQFLRKPE